MSDEIDNSERIKELDGTVKELESWHDEERNKCIELEKKLAEALNGTLLKRYNTEKEDALKKLKIAVEALELITEISYYHDYGDHRSLASEALAAINGKNKI